MEFGGGAEQTVLSAGALLGTALARHGLGQGWEEGSLGVTAYRILEVQPISEEVSRWVMGAHAGGKYNPPGCERSLALLGGVGAGTSGAGQFVSGDLGFTTGFENRKTAPNLGGKLMLDVPFGTRPVNLAEPGLDHRMRLDEPAAPLSELQKNWNVWRPITNRSGGLGRV